MVINYHLHTKYLKADKYKPLQTQLQNRFGGDAGETIPVNRISVPPLGEVLDLGRDEPFSYFYQHIVDWLDA